MTLNLNIECKWVQSVHRKNGNATNAFIFRSLKPTKYDHFVHQQQQIMSNQIKQN